MSGAKKTKKTQMKNAKNTKTKRKENNMNIKINYTPSVHAIELDRSREFWEDERNANPDMTGYREEDI